MPIDKYFGGKGEEVMASMKETYPNKKKAKRVFYATANKRKRQKAHDQAKALKEKA